MSDNVELKLRAVNQISSELQKVSADATKAGQTMQQAGKTASADLRARRRQGRN